MEHTKLTDEPLLTIFRWGFFITGAGVPNDRLPLVSRALTYDYASMLCRTLFNITAAPDIDSINKLGGFNISYPRLAFIDGAQDPWRAASPHAMGLKGRTSTTTEPFILVDWGVHHWDNYGLREGEGRPGLPPRQIVEVQQKEVEFVKEWLEQWSKAHGSKEHDDKQAESLALGEL